MCTLTYMPNAKGFVITQNRDESPERLPAVFPVRTADLLFPEDPVGGGTWMACRADGSVATILNGAFWPHQRAAAYKHSRGLLPLQVLQSSQPDSYLTDTDFSGMEAFTLVLFHQGKIQELRWDEKDKHLATLTADEPHIWQSAPLYDAAMQSLRKLWFSQFLHAYPNPSPDDWLHWGLSQSPGAPHLSICMNRGVVKTVGISQVSARAGHVGMRYLDLEDRQSFGAFPEFEAI
jgi:hypothetical protein